MPSEISQNRNKVKRPRMCLTKWWISLSQMAVQYTV